MRTGVFCWFIAPGQLREWSGTFCCPLERGWRAVGFRKMNRNMSEGEVLKWH